MLMRWCFLGFATLSLGADPYSGHIASTEPKSPQEERKAFRLPPGYEAQLVAAEPDINKPMNIAFDERGRLWVTSTVEYPFPVGPGQKSRDTVKILEDFGPDGRARKITTYADNLNIPIGLMPNSGKDESLVFSIPNIYQLRDTTGNGQADRRRVLFSEFGRRDTHGLTSAFTWGFDGWVYACHGFSNQSTVKGDKTKTITMQSGNTYRFRADGSRLEQFTWGQVNPFGLTFDPLGNLYSADCHSKPMYQLLRGGYYPSFGKPHDGLGFGPTMIDHTHGSTAISGIVYYTGSHFPDRNDTMFLGNVVTNRINHDKLAFHGSSPRAIEQRDFLVSEDPWFRPVDLQLGPDGALWVADFYNRIIGHYEVPLTHPGRDRTRGRIWRIVYRGADGKGEAPPPPIDRTKLSDAELMDDLSSPNLTVRLHAGNLLVRRANPKTLQALAMFSDKGVSATKRAHALWILHRTGTLSEELLASATKDPARIVRVHAQRILAELPTLDEEQRRLVSAGLEDEAALVQRCAADALGQHPHPDNLGPLLALRHRVPAEDTHLLYVVRMALRNQLRDDAVWNDKPFLGFDRPKDRRALVDVLLGVPSTKSAEFLMYATTLDTVDPATLRNALRHVARYGKASVREEFRNRLRKDRPEQVLRQVHLFRAFAEGTQARGARLDEAERAWGLDLIDKLLGANNPTHLQKGIELAGLLRSRKHEPRIEELATMHADVPTRIVALTALAHLDATDNAAILGKLLGDGDTPMAVRQKSAELLSQHANPKTRAQLLEKLATVPSRLQTAIATGLAANREGAELLLQALAQGKASPRLLQERGVHLRLSKLGLPMFADRLAKLTAGLPPLDEKVRTQLQQRQVGFRSAKHDFQRGAKVFEKNCAICHQLDGKGAKIGPQLDGIGIRGLDRLLEDTLDPNRNVDQAFRMTVLEMKDGQVLSGLVLREEGAVVVLADQKGKEVRLEKANIAERSTAQMSPMPANVLQEVPERDFYDLLAFLLRQRQTRKVESP